MTMLKANSEDKGLQKGSTTAPQKCPKCAEEIRREAQICGFCGYEFSPSKPVAKEAVLRDRAHLADKTPQRNSHQDSSSGSEKTQKAPRKGVKLQTERKSSKVGYIFGGIAVLLLIWLIAVSFAILNWQSARTKHHTQTASEPLSSLLDPQTVTENEEAKKIGSVFEDFRRANLQKNIDLFMSCFSGDFDDTEQKRKDTLKMWEMFTYYDLSYDLRKQKIVGDAADVQLEWVSKTSERASGKFRNDRTLLDVTLKRERDAWKIKEIRPVSSADNENPKPTVSRQQIQENQFGNAEVQTVDEIATAQADGILS